jgi:hypothetical protein
VKIKTTATHKHIKLARICERFVPIFNKSSKLKKTKDVLHQLLFILYNTYSSKASIKPIDKHPLKHLIASIKTIDKHPLKHLIF